MEERRGIRRRHVLDTKQLFAEMNLVRCGDCALLDFGRRYSTKTMGRHAAAIIHNISTFFFAATFTLEQIARSRLK